MNKKSPYRTFEEFLMEQLADPADAALYFSIAIEEYLKDQETKYLISSLQDVAAAQGPEFLTQCITNISPALRAQLPQDLEQLCKPFP